MLENVFTRLKHRINIKRKLGLFVYVFLKKVFFPVLSLFFVYILGLKYLNIWSKYMPKSKFKTNPSRLCVLYQPHFLLESRFREILCLSMLRPSFNNKYIMYINSRIQEYTINTVGCTLHTLNIHCSGTKLSSYMWDC